MDREGSDLRPRRIQGGFTLIELMMVTGIIGILASIAVPTFLQYQARARQSEARTNLGGVFVAETSYLGEQARFGCFSEIGFTLASATNRFTYRSPSCGPAGGGPGTVVGESLFQTSLPAVATVAENTMVPSSSTTPPNPNTFTATATGNVDGDAALDQWHVNDLKYDLLVPDTNDVLR